MSKRVLHISNTLTLPAELAARTQAILAMKGMGKTYLAMKETEEMLAIKQQVVCLDPTGVWYGLRLSADGKSEGFPILIFGGDNADVPLEPTAGEYLADFVQDSGRSVIFDMSHFESLSAQDRFVTDFATRLYRAKAPKEKRNTIHLMLDEADSFAPQKPAKNQLRMLGAWEAIVRRGRSRGIGLTMITQRPAVINKNVLSQVDLLVSLRIVGIHDFKAMKEWTDLYATPDQKKAFMESLPQLEQGQAWFWSPGWLRIFEKALILPKITFDSSRTPEPGEKAATPKKTAHVDLDELTEQIRATVEQAKKNDPKALIQRIATLERELQKKPHVAEDTKEIVELRERLRKSVQELERERDVMRQMEKIVGSIGASVSKIEELLNGAALVRSHISSNTTTTRTRTVATDGEVSVRTVRTPPGPRPAPAKPKTNNGATGIVGGPGAPQGPFDEPDASLVENGESLRPMPRAMLTALAQHPEGLTKAQILIYADYRSSGPVSTCFAAMQRAGFTTVIRDGRLVVTQRGEAWLGSWTPLPTGAELRDHLIRTQPTMEGKMLQVLFEEYPNALTKGDILERAGYKSSGPVSTTFAKLVRLNWATKEGNALKASDNFFR